MTQPGPGVAIQVTATARVERGTATECACGGELLQCKTCGLHWTCIDCGRDYK